MQVHQIVNLPYGSNTFIIENSSNKVVVIDPGNYEINELNTWLISRDKQISAVMLTHEHLDHNAGVNQLSLVYDFPLIASAECVSNIANSKKNFSFYYDFVPTYEITRPHRIIEDYEEIDLDGTTFRFILTPGHSPGSICIITGDSIFTGDTILNQIESPLKLPGSNKLAYSHSMNKLKSHLRSGMTIYPGHGEPFLWA